LEQRVDRTQREEAVGISRATLGLLLAVFATATGARAQEEEEVRRACFRAVADFFQMPPGEVSILGEWRLPTEEVPVALFVARRAGVSPEALVALRRSGRGWSELAGRYHLDAAHFYVPLSDDAAAGPLQAAYDQYRSLPALRWSEVSLQDRHIVDLVNLRLVSQTLRIAPATVLAQAVGAGSWDRVYRALIGDRDTTFPLGVES
jgi:hypothetical protein